LKTTNLLPAASLEANKKVDRVIFGTKIPTNDRNEIRLTLEIIKEVAENNQGKKFTFSEFFNLCKQKRTDAKFNLTAYNLLKPKVKGNFERRITRTLAGTIVSANFKSSAQSKYFNFEIATGQRIKFTLPINPTLPLTAQVKKDGQSFILPTDLTAKPKKLLVSLNKAQALELRKAQGLPTTEPEPEN